MRLRRVDPALAEATVAEFHDLSVSGRYQRRGGHDVAVGLLEASFGSERAAGVMERLASNAMGKSFEFLDEADPGQVITLLDGELPQTIALVLAHLRPQQASAVLAGLDVAARTDVAQAIATMGTATPEAVGIVATTLKIRAGAVVAPREQVEVVGGIQPLVEIINRASRPTEKSILESLSASDPELAEKVRSQMFVFEDIVVVDDRSMQLVLREVATADLAAALKGVRDDVRDKVMRNLSERAALDLGDEIELLGPVRAATVGEAQARVVAALRAMEESGQIVIDRGGEDDLIA